MNIRTWNAAKLSEWVAQHGRKFEPLASEFLANNVEGEDVMDESVFSRRCFDDMLEGVSTQFAKNKLWKKLQEIKAKNDKNATEKQYFEDPPTPKENQLYLNPFIRDTANLWSPVTSKVETPTAKPQRKRTPSYADKMKKKTSIPVLIQKPKSQNPKAAIPVLGIKPKTEMPARPALFRAKDLSGIDYQAYKEFLQGRFGITFRYVLKKKQFSIYGNEHNVLLARKEMVRRNVQFEVIFQSTYLLNTMEIHLSVQECKRLNSSKVFMKFLKENDVKMLSQSMEKTKTNGEKQRKVLFSGEEWPDAMQKLSQILQKDLNYYYTNHIFTTNHPKTDEIMLTSEQPFWQTVTRDTDTVVRVLNERGERHILVSGRISNVMRALELLKTRLSFTE